jgi:hypothetical protein
VIIEEIQHLLLHQLIGQSLEKSLPIMSKLLFPLKLVDKGLLKILSIDSIGIGAAQAEIEKRI